MGIFSIPLYDVWAMGFAVTMAIAIFAMLFVVPLAVIWFVTRGVGHAWRAARRTSGGLLVHGHAPRHGHTLG